jgi:hypothetical protein
MAWLLSNSAAHLYDRTQRLDPSQAGQQPGLSLGLRRSVTHPVAFLPSARQRHVLSLQLLSSLAARAHVGRAASAMEAKGV